jgi:hypothetical protein
MPDHPPSYLIEFTRIGGQVRVMACDPETGTEAVVMGPASATQKDMTALAVRKLRYLLEKNAKHD